MASISTSAGPCARADVTLQRVGGDAILHDARGGQAHVINEAAARVWELADGRPVEELVAAFAAPYDLPPMAVHADVVELLVQLDQLGLLA